MNEHYDQQQYIKREWYSILLLLLLLLLFINRPNEKDVDSWHTHDHNVNREPMMIKNQCISNLNIFFFDILYGRINYIL